MEPKQWFLRSAQKFLWDLFSALLILCNLKIGSGHGSAPENIVTLGWITCNFILHGTFCLQIRNWAH